MILDTVCCMSGKVSDDAGFQQKNIYSQQVIVKQSCRKRFRVDSTTYIFFEFELHVDAYTCNDIAHSGVHEYLRFAKFQWSTVVIRRSIGFKVAASFVGSANNSLESTPRESLRMKPLEYSRAVSYVMRHEAISQCLKAPNWKRISFATRRNRTTNLLVRIEERNQLD